MAKLNIVVSHGLRQEDAVQRIKSLLSEVRDQFADKISALHEEWNGNACRFSFTAMGFSVSGALTVKPSEVELSGALPFAASFFKGKIESTIRKRAQSLLA